jgi:AcrR family transcriptional regulator
MKQEDIRHKLIDGTIRVIARDGLDKATTKRISVETSTNEAYIYRCFSDKEDMFSETFAVLDNELVAVTLAHVSVMTLQNMTYEARSRIYFSAVWHFLLGNRDKCLAFIRYYYSSYFEKYSAIDHQKRYLPLVERCSVAFREEANVWMILNHVLTTMLDFAVKVYGSSVPDNEDTEEHVFRLVYASARQYFKKEKANEQL